MIIDQPVMKYVPKGWGGERWIVNNKKYCGKILYFMRGLKCSLHYHKIKDETFYVQKGKIQLYYSDDVSAVESLVNKIKSSSGVDPGVVHALIAQELIGQVLKEGDNFYIPPGRVHQMVGLQDTELFEFSTTHMDEDSYRILKGD